MAGGNFGDGFAFVLQNEGCTASGGTHGGLGFGAGTGTDCIGGPCGGGTGMFGVEFDWFDNSSGGASPIPNDGDDAGGSDVCSETGASCSQEVGVGFQFDNYESHDGSYTDPDDFSVVNELDYQACLPRCEWSQQDDPWDAAYSGPVPDTNTVTFSWDASTETFTVVVNGSTILSGVIDMSAILGTSTAVYPGLTASSGGQGQYLTACLLTVPLSLRSDMIKAHAKYLDGIANIEWEVMKSDKIDHFDIEKSKDGINWELVGDLNYLNQHSESNKAKKYVFKDYNFSNDDTYYKVIEYNGDGEIKTVSNKMLVELPNNFFYEIENDSKAFSIQTYNNKKTNNYLKIFTSQGVLLSEKLISLENNVYSFRNLNTGIYILQISDGVNVEFKKIIVN